MRAAAVPLPRSRSRFPEVVCGPASLADCLASVLVVVCFPCIAATDLLMALTASWVPFEVRSFSGAVGAALPLMMTVERGSGFAALASFSRAFAAAFA